MKVNKYNAIGSYCKISADGSRITRTVDDNARASGKNTDKAEFSSNSHNLENSIASAKAAAVKNAKSGASPEKIAELRQKISNRNYNISAEKIVAAIFE